MLLRVAAVCFIICLWTSTGQPYSALNQVPTEQISQGMMELKGMTLDHNFYVVVSKKCRTENALTGHQYNIFI